MSFSRLFRRQVRLPIIVPLTQSSSLPPITMSTATDVPVAPPSAESAAVEDDLPTLLAEATAAYSQKHYREAAELYSRATESQTEKNGEMSTENAELLYLYGRCLYHVAVENSDVLGEKVAGEKPKEKTAKKGKTNGETDVREQRITEEGVAIVAKGETGSGKKEEEQKPSATKPFFQFTGDENFDQSDDDEDAETAAEGPDGEDGEEGAAEEDELMNAFEILDLARVLLERKLKDSEPSSESKESPPTSAEDIKHLKERLADVHDLQAEISLEGEQFLEAVDDLFAALTIKQDLYPPESSYLAELHFKLSLALEFGSTTQPKGADGEVDPNQTAKVDEKMRKDAAAQMEAAIKSCKLRVEKEEAALKNGQEILLPGRKEKISQKSVDEVKELIADMEQRLVELHQPPVSINDPRGTGALSGSTPLDGILGAILGETADQQKKRLEEATKDAKDITGLVRKKKPVAADVASAPAPVKNGTTSNGALVEADVKASTKRKADSGEEPAELQVGKKAKVEDADEG